MGDQEYAGLAPGFDPKARVITLPLAPIAIATTGLSNNDAIIEVARADFATPALSKSWLINPGIPIPKEVSDINGFTNDVVSKFPTFPKEADDIVQDLQHRIPIAFNASFHCGFLVREFVYHKISVLNPPPALDHSVEWIDPFIIAQQVMPKGTRLSLPNLLAELGKPSARLKTTQAKAGAAVTLLFALMNKFSEIPNTYGELIAKQRRWARMQAEERQLRFG